MKPWVGYEETKVAVEQEKLPVGGYVLKILDAKEISYSNGGSALQISFDISEGDYKDYFKEQYNNSVFDNKKWKGVHRINIPKEDGSEMDDWTKRSFKRDIDAIEDSNNGYHWDWNEQGLKGKLVGAVFFEKEWEYNGKTGMATQCHHFTAVENIKSGKFKVPAPKMLKSSDNNGASSGFQAMDTSDESDLPF